MLTVYRASAGAGKTHKLTGEYLTLLFTGPGAFRRILAVTFTNKATDEMKTRIIDELYNLASGKKSDYVELLGSTYLLTETQVRKQAAKILIDILHDYSAFNISTIDRFFQQTMRAFTREIGLQGGYGIEMDQELVLTTAIDNLLSDLEKPESKDLLGWLLRFAEDKIENGGEWNLRKDIMSLSREVFKESYKAFSEEVGRDIEDKKALDDYKNALYGIIRSVETAAKELGERGLEILAKYALKPTDFKGGSRSPLTLFDRLAQGEMKEPSATFIGLADNLDGCFTKTTPLGARQIIGCAFEDGLNDCIKGIVTLFGDLTAYNTAREIVRYYYTLGILTDVSRQIAAYREEKNVMLIADTTELLNKVIGGSDAPFIYEKTGTHVDHYMIDEFQDTSGMQWNNFRPLIEESLAHNRDNLIVGDVKQSIYRFRLADPTIFIGKYHRFGQETDALNDLITLSQNFRSCQGVVDGVNTVFEAIMSPELGEIEYDERARLYKGLDNEGPYVKTQVHVIENKTDEDTDPMVGEMPAVELEARFIAREIQSRVGKPIFDTKTGQERLLGYRDIGVLMRSVAGRGDVYAKIFSELGIPAYFDGGEQYYESMEIGVVMNLLDLIDNHHQDLPLLSVMTRPARS